MVLVSSVFFQLKFQQPLGSSRNEILFLCIHGSNWGEWARCPGGSPVSSAEGGRRRRTFSATSVQGEAWQPRAPCPPVDVLNVQIRHLLSALFASDILSPALACPC